MANREETATLQQMRAAYAAGDVRTARRLAQTLPGSEEAARVLTHTAVDPRALIVGAGAALLGLFYVAVFLLAR